MRHAITWTEDNGTWYLMRNVEGDLIKVEDGLHELAVRQGATDVEGDNGFTELPLSEAKRLGLGEASDYDLNPQENGDVIDSDGVLVAHVGDDGVIRITEAGEYVSEDEIISQIRSLWETGSAWDPEDWPDSFLRAAGIESESRKIKELNYMAEQINIFTPWSARVEGSNLIVTDEDDATMETSDYDEADKIYKAASRVGSASLRAAESETTKTYKIIMKDNTGSRAIDSIAATVEGSWRNCVSRYDGEHDDLAFLDIAADDAEYLEDILEADDNVVEYSSH